MKISRPRVIGLQTNLIVSSRAPRRPELSICHGCANCYKTGPRTAGSGRKSSCPIATPCRALSRLDTSCGRRREVIVDDHRALGLLRDTWPRYAERSEEHTSELQSLRHLVCR